MNESVRKTFQKTARMRGVDAAWADIEAEVEQLRGLLDKNEGRVKEIVDEKLLRERDEARAELSTANVNIQQAEAHLRGTMGFIDGVPLLQMAKEGATEFHRVKAELERVRGERDDAVHDFDAVGGGLDEARAENEQLQAKVATVMAMGKEYFHKPTFPVDKLRNLLDGDVEFVRVKVGAQGWLFVQDNDGEPIGNLDDPQSMGIEEQATILLVFPPKKK